MTVLTLHMQNLGHMGFLRIMNAGITGNIMPVKFGKLGFEICTGDISIMTDQAIGFLCQVIHQPGVALCGMGIVATLTGVFSNCTKTGVKPGVRYSAIPICHG
jgi:hypothetical protein